MADAMSCADRSVVLLWSLAYLGVCALVLVGVPVYAAVQHRRRRASSTSPEGNTDPNA